MFSCSVFAFRVFQNADSAFFYPRPVVLNTDQGFPEHRPVFSRSFRHRTQAIPLVFSVPIRVPLRPRITRFACGPKRTRDITRNVCTSLGNIRYIVLGERLGSRLGNWEMPLVLSKVWVHDLATGRCPSCSLKFGSLLGNWEMPLGPPKKKKKNCVHDLAPGRCQSCSLQFGFTTWQLGDADRAL